MWTVVFFLSLTLLGAEFLLRSVRHYEKRVEAAMSQLDRDDTSNGHKFALARNEIQALAGRKTDQAIAELWVETNGPPMAENTPSPTGWTPEKNARRCALIHHEVYGTLTPSEAAELEDLQNQMRGHVNRVAPLPLDELRKLRDDLLRKVATAETRRPS